MVAKYKKTKNQEKITRSNKSADFSG